jgi:hypothetical protein
VFVATGLLTGGQVVIVALLVPAMLVGTFLATASITRFRAPA